MNMLTRIGLAAAIATGFAGNAFAQAPLAIGTNPQGSMAYAAGSAIADVVGDALGTSFTVVPMGGPTAVLPAMMDGEFDFGFANIQAGGAAYLGRGPFNGRALEGLRVATAIFPLYFGPLTSNATEIASIADIRGHRVASEFSSQRNVLTEMTTSLTLAGLTYDDVTPVPVQSGADAVNLLADGQIDLTDFSVGSGVVSQLDAAVGARFLSLPDTDEARATVAQRMAGATLVTLPAGFAAGISEDTVVYSAPFVVLTSENADEETVYNVVRAMAEHQEALAASLGQFNAMTIQMMAQPEMVIPYHPGAIRYFQERGVWE